MYLNTIVCLKVERIQWGKYKQYNTQAKPPIFEKSHFCRLKSYFFLNCVRNCIAMMFMTIAISYYGS